jgi:hypothetical protein
MSISACCRRTRTRSRKAEHENTDTNGRRTVQHSKLFEIIREPIGARDNLGQVGPSAGFRSRMV